MFLHSAAASCRRVSQRHFGGALEVDRTVLDDLRPKFLVPDAQ